MLAAIVVSLPSLMGAAAVQGQRELECSGGAELRIVVLDPSGAMPIPGATLVLHWADVEEGPLRETGGADGRFSVCAPPEAQEALLWAESDDHSSEPTMVAFEFGEKYEFELRIRTFDVPRGRLVGRVYDATTEVPVATASISVIGHARLAESTRQGHFALNDVRAGDHALEVRRIGYATLRYPITVTQGLTTDVEIGLVPDPVEMEPLVATVTRLRRLEIRGFYERKRWSEQLGLGTFITADEIERRRPLRIGDMIRETPGVQPFGCNRRGVCRFRNSRLSSGWSGPCEMTVFLDHVKLTGVRVDDYVLPLEVAGVEIYLGAASLPAEYGGADARCGAIVIWTK